MQDKCVADTSVDSWKDPKEDGFGLLLPAHRGERQPSFWRRILSFVLFTVLFLGGMWRLEQLSEPPALHHPIPIQKTCQRQKDGRMPRKCRVFIILADSLRYEMAIDARMMPGLARLQRSSLWGRLKSCKDHNTTPCIRASMEGRYHMSIFGFVYNFSASQNKRENILGQANKQGFKTYVISDRPVFTPYMHALAKFEETHGNDARAMNRALEAYKSQKYDIIFLHLMDTDHVAHSYGIYASRYKKVFRTADQQIEKIAKIVHPDETLLVFGDHGHSADGSHKFGSETPSYYFIRNAIFQKGVRQNAEIKDVRYFLSRSLRIPLPSDYQGNTYPSLLKNAKVHVPKNQKRAVLKPAKGENGGVAFYKWGFWLALALIALAGVLWYWLHWQGERISDGAACSYLGALSFVSALALAHGSVLVLGVVCGLLFVWFLWLSHPWHKWMLWFLVLFCLPFAFLAWSKLLLFLRPKFHLLLLRHWMAYLFLAGCLVVSIGFFVRLSVSLHLLWVIGAFLLIPTVYFYGSMGTLFAALLGLALFLSFRPSQSFQSSVVARYPRVFLGRLLAFSCLGFLFGFLYINSGQYTFVRFALWDLVIKPHSALVLFIFIFSKIVLYLDFRVRWWRQIVSVALGIFVGLCEYGLWTKASLISAGVLGVSYVLLSWRVKKRKLWLATILGENFRLRSVLGFAFLQFSMVYLLRIKQSYFVQFNGFLACLVLLIWAIRLFRDEELRRVAPLVLAMIGYLGSFWFTLHWGTGHLEWRFVYDFLSATEAERFVIFVSSANVIKYLIPVFLVRLLFTRNFPGLSGAIKHHAQLWMGLKILSLVGMCYGFGATAYASNFFGEGIQHLLLTLICFLGILL